LRREMQMAIGQQLRDENDLPQELTPELSSRYVLTSAMEAAVTWIFISAAIALVIAISSATDASFPSRSDAN
jgi:hypothetical protein